MHRAIILKNSRLNETKELNISKCSYFVLMLNSLSGSFLGRLGFGPERFHIFMNSSFVVSIASPVMQ